MRNRLSFIVSALFLNVVSVVSPLERLAPQEILNELVEGNKVFASGNGKNEGRVSAASQEKTSSESASQSMSESTDSTGVTVYSFSVDVSDIFFPKRSLNQTLETSSSTSSTSDTTATDDSVPVPVESSSVKEAQDHPSAVILMCSESLPDPHLIFDQPIGTLLTVRNMGNIIPLLGLQPNSVDTGSIEYGVEEQGARVIIVLGHTGCSVVDSVIKNPEGRGNMVAIYQVISSAITVAKRSNATDLQNAVVEQNVRNSVAALRGDAFNLSKRVASGKLKIVGAIYNPETSKVTILE